jgi:hypothetical protein
VEAWSAEESWLLYHHHLQRYAKAHLFLALYIILHPLLPLLNLTATIMIVGVMPHKSLAIAELHHQSDGLNLN